MTVKKLFKSGLFMCGALSGAWEWVRCALRFNTQNVFFAKTKLYPLTLTLSSFEKLNTLKQLYILGLF